ncbi:unnamed protein product [Allacma fusca]|nr:unnamed protein product [Allacma fusca]
MEESTKDPSPLEEELTQEIDMFTANEPRYYKEGFGIRTENIIRVVVVSAGGEGNFLTFPDVTLVPIQIKVIKSEQLALQLFIVLKLVVSISRVSKEVGKYLTDNGDSYPSITWLEKHSRLTSATKASFMKVSFLAVITCIYNTVDKLLQFPYILTALLII